MLQHEDALEQASNARGRLQVPDVRFNGANVKVIRPGNIVAEDLGDGRNLFSVACLSSLSEAICQPRSIPPYGILTVP